MNDYSFEDYSQEIYTKIMQEAQYEGANPEVQFLQNCIDIMDDIGEFDEPTIIEDGVDGVGRWKINGYALENDNTRLCCFICDFDNSSTPKNFNNTDVKKLVKKINNFLVLVLESDIYSKLEPTSEVFVAAELIKSCFATINKIEVFIVTNKPASNRLSHLEEEDIAGTQTVVHLWDLKRFFQLEVSGRERDAMIIEFPKPLRCLVTQESTDNTISCLVIIDGQTLFEIFSKWQSRLLERNVRTYLQNRSKVNKGIIETIKTEPEKFFAYNNGLTTTADSIEFTDSNQNQISSLTNFQIVNGAQTTSSLYNAVLKEKADISHVSLQMKLTVVEPESVDKLVPRISRYANSQNKVNDADFFSNHEFHVEFEKISNRVSAPPKAGLAFNTYWFYERTRGQYLNKQSYMTASEKRRWRDLHPRNQMITKTDLAKFENTWMMLPGLVSKGAQANFNEFAKKVENQWSSGKKDEFNEFYFKKCIVHAIVFKALEFSIPKQHWYAGFRANILIYTISYFSKWLSEKKLCLNYHEIYNKQECPQLLLNQLCIIGYSVNEQLHSVDQNLTTYAKGTLAWKDISALDIKFNDEVIRPYLVNIDKLNIESKKAKNQQKMDNQLSGEAKILQLKPAHWIEIKNYLANMEMLSPKRIGILSKAVQFDGAVLNMSTYQRKELIGMLQLFQKDKGVIELN